jgi:ribosomal-protein-serine acetyltransferase
MQSVQAMFVLNPTPDLTIRPFIEADADALFDQVDRNRPHLREWLVWVDDTRGVGEIRDFIGQSMEQFARDDGYQAGIFVKDRLAGAIGLHYVNRHNLSTEIGYWLAKGYNGQGIMTAAVRAVTSHAFTTWNLNRVEIRAAAGNHRSRAIAERLGFTLEGVLRQAHNIYGELHDLAIYGMLRIDWKLL